ncbi:ketoacyl-synthetase C-terminal extension domain-containing protein, partial [Streptomyces sp. NPDC059233]
ALLATYGRRPAGQPLMLGSLKSNIGHTQAAAGVGGVIKMVMAMRHGTVPKTLHVDAPTPNVEWDSGAVELVTETVAWPVTGRPRRAAVSSFGISGTNAHVIVEQAPEGQGHEGQAPEADAETGPAAEEPQPPVLRTTELAWPLSAGSPEALRAQAVGLLEHSTAHPGTEPAAITRALARGRAALTHRAVVLGATRPELEAGLRALAAGEDSPYVVQGVAGDERLAYALPAPDSRWRRTARELAAAAPAFLHSLESTARALAAHTDAPVLDAVLGTSGSGSSVPEAGAAGTGVRRAERPADAVTERCALFAATLALVHLWRELGVEPELFVGDTVHEAAAAHAAGALSLDAAARSVALGERPDLARPSDPWFRPRPAVDAGAAGSCPVVDLADPASLLAPLAAAWAGGAPVDWAGATVAPAGGDGHVDLPTYPFQRQSYWLGAPERTVTERQSVTWAPATPDPAAGLRLALVPAGFADDPFVTDAVAALGADGTPVATRTIALDGAADDEEGLAALLAQAVAETRPAAVLSLLDTDATPCGEALALPRGTVATLALARVLHGLPDRPVLWCATDDTRDHPAPAALAWAA